MGVNSLSYELGNELARHITSTFYAGGDEVIVPDAFIPAMQYEDRDGVTRVLAPHYVSIGRFQANPLDLGSDPNTEPPSRVSILANDPFNAGTWTDVIAGIGKNDFGITVPAREISSAVSWWRRFLVEFTVFFTSSNQNQNEAYRLMSNFGACLETISDHYSPHGWNEYGWDVGGIQSAFGEKALSAHVVRSELMQRGGPKGDAGMYIGYGRIWLQVLTKRS